MSKPIYWAALWSARIAVLFVAVLALAVSAGYALRNVRLIIVAPGLPGMSVLTLLGLLILAASVLCESIGRPIIARCAAVMAVAIGGTLFALHVVTGQDFVSPALAAWVFGIDPSIAGRMSSATATCLILLGVAGTTRRYPSLADGTAGVALTISGVALLGYWYGVSDLYAMLVFKTMALHTALAMFLLSLASLAVKPERGWAALVLARQAGGSATRRQLAFTLMPPIAGWLLLKGSDAHQLGPAAAMAMLVVLTILPLVLLILRDGRILTALDAERRANADLQDDLQHELERRLAQQAAELEAESAERSKAELSLSHAQRIEAMGQLTGGIAHDFNNLLMAVSGNLQLLMNRVPEDERAQRYVGNALLATERATKLTGQLLAFSRKQNLDIRPVELDPIIERARAMIGSSLGSKVSIDLRLNAPGLWAATDADQLELAILNLALNARDAMPAGGDLIIASGACRARLQDANGELSYLSVTVIDTGEGMSAEVAAKAIEPFFTTKERGKGTGLGMAQAYGFARQCHGDLRITSQLGRGTTIELLLPCVKDRRSELGTDRPHLRIQAASLPDGGQSKLLVIDDDDGVRAVLIDILSAGGYEVIDASNGIEGLRLLETCTPAAAIIDFHMPGLNGAEVARRALLQQIRLPIVFVSGYFDTEALDSIPGAVVVRKPFNADYLQRAVASAVHRGNNLIH